jgi:5-methyltetrahydrofolate--homocysteine methyltransferase
MAEAMSAVGRLYEAGEFFLPELVMAGATMQAGMEILKPYLHEQGGEGALLKGKVILGTVKGDLHDIGKNLVRTMLEGAQFEVIDLGVDVPPAKFVEAVQTHASHVVALSALLTTTLPAMRQTMQALETAGLRPGVKVIVGGAPISREFAEQIGAEGYAASAVGAVAEVERLLGLG